MSNQLDNFFKNKLQQQTFEYDEIAWEDARLLIEEQERSKKKRRFGFFFAALGVLMLVGVSAYQFGKSSNESTVKPIPAEPVELKINNNKIETIAQSSDKTESIITSEDLTDTKKISSKTKYSDKPITLSQKITITDSKTEKALISNTETTINKNLNLSTAKGVAGSTTTNYRPTITSIDPNTVAQATPQPSVIDTKSEIANANISLLPLNHLQNLVEPNENALDFVNLLPAMNQPVEPNPSQTVNKNNWFFGLRAGAALIPLDFMDFEAGVEIGYQFNRNWSLAFQPKYQYQDLAESTVEETRVDEFGFGLRSSAYSLHSETVVSIHFPLMLSYSFDNRSINLNDNVTDRFQRNKISIGAAYVYLDGITGSILQKEGAGQTTEVQTGWLSSQTFNRHNAELMIAYERYLTMRLAIGLQARYRIRNQFSDRLTQLSPDIIAPDALYLGLQLSHKLF